VSSDNEIRRNGHGIEIITPPPARWREEMLRGVRDKIYAQAIARFEKEQGRAATGVEKDEIRHKVWEHLEKKGYR